MPKSESDLVIQAQHSHLLVFDNISSLNNNISDSLCSLATGSGFSTRTLYSNDDLTVLEACRPFVLNGISNIAHRPDLLERSMSLKLPSMPANIRKTEAEIKSAFEQLQPKVLGHLYRSVSQALLNMDAVKTPEGIRMADAAKWILAAEPATCVPEGSLVAAIINSQGEIVSEALLNNSLVLALLDLLNKGPFNGHVGELYNILSEKDNCYSRDKYFPRSAPRLSKELAHLKPALLKIGIKVDFLRRTNTGQRVKISKVAGFEASDTDTMDDGQIAF